MFRNGWLIGRRGSQYGTLAGLVAAVLLLGGCGSSSDTIVSGRFGPDEPVSLQNLTVQDGRYVVSFSLEVFIASQSGEAQLTCAVTDTTGRLAQLPGLVRTVDAGRWQLVGAQTVLELPDLTMGIRCFPDRDVTLQLVLRNVLLTAQPVQ